MSENADDRLASFGKELEARRAAAWFNQPKPSRWHKCVAAESGLVGGDFVDRCACGGIRVRDRWDDKWSDRNSRR